MCVVHIFDVIGFSIILGFTLRKLLNSAGPQNGVGVRKMCW